MKGMKRPVAEVLPESATVPQRNIRKAPEHFTHEVKEQVPFWYDDAGKKNPDGELRDGAKVVIESREGTYAWITDDHGLHVQVALDALVPLA